MTSSELPLVDSLAQLSFIVQGVIDDHAASHGLSPVMGRMLGILRDRTPLMSDLGARLGLDKASISGLVSRAQARGLVTRTRSHDDGRAVLVQLTPAGATAIAEMTAEFASTLDGLLEHLPAGERAEFARLVSALLIAHADATGFSLIPD